MLCGIPPFYNENIERMYELIKHSEIRFPRKIKISDDAKDLVQKASVLLSFLTETPQPDLESMG